jgi:hypothetical protein
MFIAAWAFVGVAVATIVGAVFGQHISKRDKRRADVMSRRPFGRFP